MAAGAVLAAGVAVLVGWMLLVRAFRYRHVRMLEGLDPERDAQRIVCLTSSKEFPLTGRLALEMALFRTYAIPSISKILAG